MSRSPLRRFARELGMDGSSTLEEVRAAVAHKSWTGSGWVDGELNARAE